MILVGPPEAGKTTIRLFFFEGVSSAKLLQHHGLEPTRGVNWFNYDRNETTIGVVDTSGQEIIEIITDYSIFEAADAVIFMFDVAQYLSSPLIRAEYLEYILEVINCRSVLHESFEILIFGHKIDLIPENMVDEVAEKIQNEIEAKIHEKFNHARSIVISFTSLFPEMLGDISALLQNILK